MKNPLLLLASMLTFPLHCLYAQTSTNSLSAERTKNIRATIVDARSFYSQLDKFVTATMNSIDTLDKGIPREEGLGFMGGFKKISIDGGKTYAVINWHWAEIAGGRNGVRNALKDLDALPHEPTSYDYARFAEEFMFQSDVCLEMLEKPNQEIISLLRSKGDGDTANTVEKWHAFMKNQALTMRLRLHWIVGNYLEEIHP